MATARPGAAVGRVPATGRPPLPLVFTITITGILANTLINPAVPDILADFNQPDSRVGVLVSAGTLPGIVMAPVIGLLADRYGRRAVVVPCLVAFGAFGALAGLAPSFGALVAARFLQGVASAGLVNLAVVIIGDHWDGTERIRRLGQNSAVLTVSLAVFPPLGGLLTELGSWRLSFAPYLVGLVSAVVVWRRLPGGRPVDASPHGEQLRAAGRALRDRTVLVCTVLGFATFFLIFGLFLATLPIHLERQFGLGAGARGLIQAVPATTAALAALSVRRLRRRFGAGRLVTAAMAGFAVSFVAIGQAPLLGLLIVAALGYGLAQGVLIPTLQDRVTSAATPASRGAVVAAFVGAARAGQTAGPAASGLTLGAFGTGTTFLLGGALAAVTTLVANAGSRFVDGAEPAPDEPVDAEAAAVAD